MKKASRSLVAAVAAGALVVVGGAGAAAAHADGNDRSIVGAWRMSIDPRPNPAGDPPAFPSRIEFSKGGTVTDASSSFPPGWTGGSSGIGAWSQDDGQATFTFERFLYGPSGFAIQRIHGTTTLSSDGTTQAGPAYVTILGADGTTILKQFVVDASGTRMTP